MLTNDEQINAYVAARQAEWQHEAAVNELMSRRAGRPLRRAIGRGLRWLGERLSRDHAEDHAELGMPRSLAQR